MILKMKSDVGWTLVPIQHSVHYEKNIASEPPVTIGDEKCRFECKIKVWKNGEDAPEVFITYGEAYLINDVGVTIERIN